MIDTFIDALETAYNAEIEKWHTSGKRIVGYTCSFLPLEILHAADILPVRLRGIQPESLVIGDTYYGPFVCTFPKTILQLVGEGKYAFLDGAIVSTGCDAMRRLDECWRKADEDIAGILPPFFHYFDVPHKVAPHSLKWFTDEIKTVIGALERHFDVTLSNADLTRAIKAQNRIRHLIDTLNDFRASDICPLTGTDFYTAMIAGTVLPQEVYADGLTELIRQINENKDSAHTDKKRILISGSVCDDADLIRLIESCGCVVVAENLCFGIKDGDDRVAEDSEPISALARRYLAAATCPRMFGGYQDRLKLLKTKIEKFRVDGVIVQNVRFCELHSAENGLFERDLAALNVPVLRVEREYGPITETGRMKMRVDAFLEKMSRQRRVS